MGFRLVSMETGQLIMIGDDVVTFRGETFALRGIEPPRHAASTGRVHIARPCSHTDDDHDAIYWCKGEDQGWFFPSVIGASIVADAA